MSAEAAEAESPSGMARLGRTDVIGPAAEAPTDTSFFCALRASRLLSGDEVAALEQRYHAERGLDLVARLVDSGRLTKYQYQRLRRNEPMGLVIGPYHVVDELGRGGGGHVYKARHTVLGRYAALKVVDPRYTEGRAAPELFRREVTAITMLDHPNIARVYDANDTGNLLFLAMEFVDGPTLHRHVLERGSLPPALGAAALMQVAQALQHAHEHGLVHRDIKPANIMFPGALRTAADDARPLVKVVDFGLARLRPWGEHGMSTIQCPDGTAMGTPAFMSPEQIRNVHGVDVRSDLYSLGCTFYFALAGRLPFEAPTTRLALAMHLEQEPPPLRSVCPAVPVALARIVHRMMAKNPADRYQTPADLIAALNECVLSGGLSGGIAYPALRLRPVAAEPPPAPPAPWPGMPVVPESERPSCVALRTASAANDFCRLWRQWCAVIEARAYGEPPQVSIEGYKELYRDLLAALPGARDALPEVAPEQAEQLETVIEPWVTLAALAMLDRHALAQLWNECQRFDALLVPPESSRSRWAGALPSVLVCAALVTGLGWVFAFRPDLTVSLVELARTQPLYFATPLVVVFAVLFLFRTGGSPDNPVAPRAH